MSPEGVGRAAHDGCPSVASRMYFGFVVVRVRRYATAELIAAPVGVPLPCGWVMGFVVSLSAPTTAAAFIGAIGTTTLSVMLAAMHASPGPSGKTLRPQDSAESVSMMTCLSAGITASHLYVTPS